MPREDSEVDYLSQLPLANSSEMPLSDVELLVLPPRRGPHASLLESELWRAFRLSEEDSLLISPSFPSAGKVPSECQGECVRARRGRGTLLRSVDFSGREEPRWTMDDAKWSAVNS